MFFILSKLLSFLLSPIIWVITLLIIALRLKDERKRKKALLIGLIVSLIFTNSFIVDECFRLWEYTSEDFKTDEKFEYAIVLGGMTSYDEDKDRIQFEKGCDRLFQTLRLLQKGIVKKIIITGGSGSIEHPETKEAAIIKRYLKDIKMPDSLIIIENESKNTHENAIFTKKLCDSLHIKSNILLVTSAFHMRRSIGCFEKAGFQQLRPWSADRYSGPRKFVFDHCFIPNSEATNRFYLFFHEITGYIIYKISGYI